MVTKPIRPWEACRKILNIGTRPPSQVRAEAALLDPTSLRVVVLFRVLSLAWMGLLVGLTLSRDPTANQAITILAMTLAVIWTMLTAFVARRPHVLASDGFVVADLAVALSLGAASTLAGSKDLFHGGMPMSFVVVAAFAGGMRWALLGGVAVAAEQYLLHILDGRGPVPAAGSVVFIVFGLTAGWAFDSWRIRWEVEARLKQSLKLQARSDERAALANQLHDSALQTFTAIGAAAEDPKQVRYLARRQTRELRSTIEAFRSPHENSFRVSLLGLRDEIEDLHPVSIEAVVRGDSELDSVAQAVLTATHELLVNAAKHSGVSEIDLYASLGDDIEVVVRDRGVGFDTKRAGQFDGLGHALYRPIHQVGGEVMISSDIGEGTEASIRVRRP